jgi:hypothetical protein
MEYLHDTIGSNLLYNIPKTLIELNGNRPIMEPCCAPVERSTLLRPFS